MNQQVSIEDALAVFRKRASDLADANGLLEARAVGLERQISQLETEKSELMKELEAVTTPDTEPKSPLTSEC